MNSRKGLLKTLIAAVLFSAIVLIANVSNASEAQNARILNIEHYRRSTGYNYKAAIVHQKANVENPKEQVMWKIYEYNTVGGTPVNINNAFYCLKMGVGFGSENGSPVETTLYNLYADMKQPTAADKKALIDAYINTLPGATLEEKTQHYNSIVWILDHCYVPAPSVSPTQEQIDTAAASRTALLTAAKIPNTSMNDDLIDLIQQLAIWYFSNDDEYKAQNLTNIDAKLVNTGYDSIIDVFDDWDLLGDINDPENPGDVRKLLNYFKTNGEANKNTAPSATSTNPIQLVNTDVNAVLDGDNYIVGPFKIEELSNIDYVLEGSFKDSNGTDIPYTPLDANKADTDKTLKQLVGQNFYLKVAKTANVEGAKFKVSATVMQNTITYWTKQGTNVQPVAEVVKKPKTYEAEVTVTKKIFDLALRKFISAVETNGVTTVYGDEFVFDDEEVPVDRDRTPNVDTSKLNTTVNNEFVTTATYKHRKDPILVEKGSLITYSLRIYNEGDVEGLATKVIDQLPKGVKFIRVISANYSPYGTYDPEGDNRITLLHQPELNGRTCTTFTTI